MAKIRRLIRLLGRRDFFLRTGGIIAVLLGVASAVFGIVGWHLEVIYAVAFGIGVTLLAAAVVAYQLDEPSVSVDSVLPHDKDSAMSRLHCPCSRSLADGAKFLAASYFGSSMNIDPNVYEQLRLKNRFILACLTNARGELLGYFDAIPLEVSFARSFLRGDVTELQITHEDVLSPEEMPSCKYLYLAGIAAQKTRSADGSRYTRVLIWAFFRYLERFYGEAQPFAFAVASTKAGDLLAQRLKMELKNDGRNRADGFKLYSIELSQKEMAKRRAFIEDYSAQCALDWTEHVERISSTKKLRRTPPPLRTSGSSHRDARLRRIVRKKTS